MHYCLLPLTKLKIPPRYFNHQANIFRKKLKQPYLASKDGHLAIETRTNFNLIVWCAGINMNGLNHLISRYTLSDGIIAFPT